jgi:hypothetical protein
MQQLKKIDIDLDIYKVIEAERRSFDEEPYMALRRLLRLPALKPADAENKKGIPWSEDGVTVPHGSMAKMEYLRGEQVYYGQFLNGKLVVNGRSFKTLSAAACAIALTKDGVKTSLNGWQYWQAKFPGEDKWRWLRDERARLK